MIACTNIQNFKEGETCASTISVEQTLGSDMILFCLGFKFQELSVMLVAALINFGVKNQVLQVSFKTAAGDLMSFHTFGSDMNLFGSDMILFGSNMILFGSSFKFKEPSVILVSILINFGEKNEVPKVSFEIDAGDLMLVLFYEFDDIIFYEYLCILEIISYFRSDPFTLIDLYLPTNLHHFLHQYSKFF